MANLLFRDPPLSGQPVALVFGDIAGVAGDVAVTLSGTLPALGGHIGVARVFGVSLAATLPGLAGTVNAVYFTDTQRPTVAQVLTLAQVAQPVEGGITQPQQHAQPTNSGFEDAFAQALPAGGYLHAAYSEADHTATHTASAFAEADRYAAQVVQALMQDGTSTRQSRSNPFTEAVGTRSGLIGVMQDGVITRQSRRSHFTEGQRGPLVRYQGRAGAGMARERGVDSRFQDAWVPRPGQYVPPVIPPEPPPYWGAHLLFACPPLAYPALLFGVTQCTPPTPPDALFYILPARVYMTAHTITAQRLPDLADVPIFEATLGADSGSYCWSLSASGPASLFELLAPVAGLPAQIRITLDGMPWVFAIDAISRNAAFGKTGTSVQGRSVTSLIAAPYVRSQARIEPDDKTAQQIALIDLAGTGVDLDWGIGAGALANGGMVDWFVPAGAYSRQGTALEAVSRIVQAAGGYLQSHRANPTLLARHPYGQRIGDVSGAPWHWGLGAADVELAPDAIITSAITRRDGPDVNAVYVSGTSHGVLALVKRAGSAGDKLASMVTDSLITHTDAARQAGLAVLGAAGPKYAVQLDLPVLTGPSQPGVIDVGALVQVNASVPWRGRVRGVQVSAKQPSLRQTITLERHLEA